MAERVNQRYELEQPLGGGGIGQVYHASDRLATDEDNRQLALKRITIPADQLAFDDPLGQGLLGLARTFQTIATLRHVHVSGVYGYGFEQTESGMRLYYTSPLLDNTQTITDFAQGKTTQEKYKLVGQLLQALIYIHRRGIIHRAVKPSNVLVRDGQVRVIDAGLSRTATADEHERSTPMGVLAYLPPEVLEGRPTSVAGDLYAVGLILYELLAGEFPYQRTDTEELIANITYFTPDLDALQVPNGVSLVLLRLLSKDPDDRYRNALDTLLALEEGTGLRLGNPMEDLRDGMLFSPRMVGRDPEIAQIRDALSQAEAGSGSAWLITAESGVGKTRFAGEVRLIAMVRGATVLRCAAEDDLREPFAFWQPVVRWLAMLPDLTDDESRMLSRMVPDIARISGRKVAPVSGDGNSARVFATISALLLRAAARTPLVLLLEDVQRLDDEQLALMQQICALAPSCKLMIVATAHVDDGSGLAEHLGVRTIALKRLSVRYISELTQQILGPAGELPIVNALLYRETEGNVFFLMEVMRTLAEQVGDLGMIGIKTLPEQLFVGGVQEAVGRRLDRVRDDARPLLALAALAGQTLDLRVLRQFAPPHTLEAWLANAGDVAVLEPSDGDWAFAHEKLRDGLIARIPAAKRAAEYARLAEATEQAYGDDPYVAGLLATYWMAAGNTEKHAYYKKRAALLARLTGTSDDFVRAPHTIAEEIVSEETAPPVDTQDVPLLVAETPDVIVRRHLAQVETYRQQGNYAEALTLLNTALGLCDDTMLPERARVLASAADIYAETGNDDDAETTYQSALASALAPDAMRLHILLRLGNLLRQKNITDTAIVPLLEALDLSLQLEQTEATTWLMRVLLGMYQTRGGYDQAVICTQILLANALDAKETAAVGVLTGTIGILLLRSRQLRYAEQALMIAAQLARLRRQPGQQAEYTLNLALYGMEYSLFAEALARAEEAAALAQQAGDNALRDEAQFLDARISVLIGIKDARTAIAEVKAVMQASNDPQVQINGNYSIWKLDPSRTTEKQAAIAGLRAAYIQTSDAFLASQLKEITGDEITTPPPLPRLPASVNPQDMDVLLLRAEVLLP